MIDKSCIISKMINIQYFSRQIKKGDRNMRTNNGVIKNY